MKTFEDKEKEKKIQQILDIMLDLDEEDQVLFRLVLWRISRGKNHTIITALAQMRRGAEII